MLFVSMWPKFCFKALASTTCSLLSTQGRDSGRKDCVLIKCKEDARTFYFEAELVSKLASLFPSIGWCVPQHFLSVEPCAWLSLAPLRYHLMQLWLSSCLSAMAPFLFVYLPHAVVVCDARLTKVACAPSKGLLLCCRYLPLACMCMPKTSLWRTYLQCALCALWACTQATGSLDLGPVQAPTLHLPPCHKHLSCYGWNVRFEGGFCRVSMMAPSQVLRHKEEGSGREERRWADHRAASVHGWSVLALPMRCPRLLLAGASSSKKSSSRTTKPLANPRKEAQSGLQEGPNVSQLAGMKAATSRR